MADGGAAHVTACHRLCLLEEQAAGLETHLCSLTHSRRMLGRAGENHEMAVREAGPGRTPEPNAPDDGRFVGTGETADKTQVLLLGKSWVPPLTLTNEHA